MDYREENDIDEVLRSIREFSKKKKSNSCFFLSFFLRKEEKWNSPVVDGEFNLRSIDPSIVSRKERR